MIRIHKLVCYLFVSALVLSALASCAARMPVATEIHTQSPDHEAVINLRFVTNRSLEQSGSGASYLGGDHGPLTAGFCKAAFKAGDRWGDILRIDTAPVDSVLEVPSAGRLIIYIHGYSESFDRSCRRAAVMQRRLRLDDRMILYSWPSGSYVSYAGDALALDESLDELNEFLSRAIDAVGQERVVLMAHSMGSRGIVNALKRREDDAGRFSDAIFLAPDIRRDAFFENLQMLQEKVSNITVYTSDNDLVLWLSTVVNASGRLGISDDIGIDPAHAKVIDISPTGVSFIGGHLYHIFNAAVAEDLRSVLGSAVPGASRAWHRVPGESAGVWRLEAS